MRAARFGLGRYQAKDRTVAAYIEQLGLDMAKPSVKQHLAAIRQLFDYLVTGGFLPSNPAGAVRGPKYVVKRGKTPVLSADQARQLLARIVVLRSEPIKLSPRFNRRLKLQRQLGTFIGRQIAAR